MTPAVSLSPETVPRRVDGFAVKRTPCCYLLTADEGKRTVMTLNQTSALVWELCNGEWSVGEMLATLRDSFSDAGDQIEADVQKVLDEFSRAEVIAFTGP